MTKLIDFLENDANVSKLAIENEKLSLAAPTENIVVRHSSLFHQPFSEHICEQLCNIFQKYQTATDHSTRRTALEDIENLITNDTPDETPTLECLLYATRIVNSIIDNNAVLFDCLADKVAQCYCRNGEIAFDAVKHIFERWNWDCQVGIALIGAIKAEDNPAKRQELLFRFNKYMEQKAYGDPTHKLLLYKIKAMCTRGEEFRSQIEQIIVQNLTGENISVNNDRQIAALIVHNATSIFGNTPPDSIGNIRENKFARDLLRKLKRQFGNGETDDNFTRQLINGNENEDVRREILRRIVSHGRPIAYFCDLIRQNNLNNYKEDLLELAQNYWRAGKIQNVCRALTTFCQMTKRNKDRFNSFIEQFNFDEDFIPLMKYLHNQRTGKNFLQEAINNYFSENCSLLLQEGIKQTVKYNDEMCEGVLNIFNQLLQSGQENTPAYILNNFAPLLTERRFVDKINTNPGFFAIFNSILKSEAVNLDTQPDFFDAMITIAERCPRNLTRNFWFDAHNKTQDLRRKSRLRQHMRGPDVVNA